jgi:hypothetical protein
MINNRSPGRNQVRKKELQGGRWWENVCQRLEKNCKNSEAKKLILKEARVLDGP